MSCDFLKRAHAARATAAAAKDATVKTEMNAIADMWERLHQLSVTAPAPVIIRDSRIQTAEKSL